MVLDIKRVAICGGGGSFLLSNAICAKADIFITADFKYHEFFDAENDIIIADIGQAHAGSLGLAHSYVESLICVLIVLNNF